MDKDTLKMRSMTLRQRKETHGQVDSSFPEC